MLVSSKYSSPSIHFFHIPQWFRTGVPFTILRGAASWRVFQYVSKNNVFKMLSNLQVNCHGIACRWVPQIIFTFCKVPYAWKDWETLIHPNTPQLQPVITISALGYLKKFHRNSHIAVAPWIMHWFCSGACWGSHDDCFVTILAGHPYAGNWSSRICSEIAGNIFERLRAT